MARSSGIQSVVLNHLLTHDITNELSIREFLEKEAQKRNLLQTDSCAKCGTVYNITIHHILGRKRKGSKKPRESFFDRTIEFLGYSPNTNKYKELSEKKRIYLCEECHLDLHKKRKMDYKNTRDRISEKNSLNSYLRHKPEPISLNQEIPFNYFWQSPCSI